MLAHQIQILLLIFTVGTASTCQSGSQAKVINTDTAATAGDTLPYYLAEPNLTIFLENEELKEVSGLSPSNRAGEFIAVQDEKGIAFFLDGTAGGGIRKQVLFREKGDFEGVEMVGDTLYAVKSDGKIFQVSGFEKEKPNVAEFKTELKKEVDDVEGLGYDPKRNALLLACKGNPDSLAVRRVFAFDLKTKKLAAEPCYLIDPQEVEQILGKSEEDKKKYFSPSGIALHPKRAEVFVLSSVGKLLVVLDYSTGKIKYVVKLDKSILPQPEGIAFDKDGNLFLSSEGKKGEGLLLRFDLRK